MRLGVRTAGLLASLGLVIGGVVAVVVHVVSWTASPSGVVYHGEYVPLQGITMSRAYSSTLSITSDAPHVHPSWWPLLPVALGLGLVVGAAVGGLLGWRGIGVMRVSGSSPTG